MEPAQPAPPTERQDVVDVLHGVPVPDPSRWLEDASQPAVRAWVDAQDAHARAHLDALPERDALVTRLRELFYVDSVSAPRRYGDRLFYSRRNRDRE
ncbi:MAG: peptidase S9, partial [Proteobacteria bacterium]